MELLNSQCSPQQLYFEVAFVVLVEDRWSKSSGNKI